MSHTRHVLINPQVHRRLFLLYPRPQINAYPLPVRHILYQATGQRCIKKSTGRRDEKYCPKSNRSNYGKSADIQCRQGEVERGYKSMVRAEVCVLLPKTGCLALDWEAVGLIREQGLYGLGYSAGVSGELSERLRAA